VASYEPGGEIVVVGSANLDLVVAVDRHPRPGETVPGGDLRTIPGGKGANQATAAARLGRATSMVGCVGDDAAAGQLRRSLDEAGVDTSHLSTVNDTPTGTALITVAADGNNTIVVSSGANAHVSPASVAGAGVVDDAKALLLQLEIPIESVTAAARRAAGIVLLNPAPAPNGALPEDLVAAIDVLMPNETELAALTGVDPGAPIEDLAAAARTIGVHAAIITSAHAARSWSRPTPNGWSRRRRSTPSTPPGPATRSARRWPTSCLTTPVTS